MTQIFPHVVDLSHHNFDEGQTVDWRKAKNDGVWGVIFKATEDCDYIDPYYDDIRRQVRNAGLLWGAYHFFRPGNVVQQAEHFLANAVPGPQTLLVLDHEDPGCSLEDVKLFLRTIEDATGQRPCLYSGHVLKEQIGNQEDLYLAGTRLWLAQYGPELEWPPNWSFVWLWQFTDGDVGPQPHSMDGIGHCDINSYAGSHEHLKATWAAPPTGPITELPPKPEVPDVPDVPNNNEVPAWLNAMRSITGMTEAPGSADNPAILHMADAIGRAWPAQKSYADGYQHDDTPWCGLTVAYCMTMAGIEPVFGPTDTDRWMWALAWSEWPESMLLDEPRLGCVVVTERDGGGHVTLFEEKGDPGYYRCRGGNQSDQVNVTNIAVSSIVAMCWPREKPRVQIALDNTESQWVQATINLLSGPTLVVDGELGPLSREAIAAYQVESDLHATGLADKKTVAAMLEDVASWNNARPPRNKR